MSVTPKVALAALSFLSGSVYAAICEPVNSSFNYQGTGQLFSELNTKDVSDIRSDAYFYTQKTPDSHLLLTPNNVFFEEGVGFNSTDDDGTGAQYPDSAFNGHKKTHFNVIKGWRTDNAELIWPVYINQAGDANLAVNLRVGPEDLSFSGNGTLVNVSFHNQVTGERIKTSCRTFNNSDSSSKAQWNITFPHIPKGFYYVTLSSPSIARNEVGDLHSMILSGGAAKNAEMVRARWRPAAVHVSYTSSLLPQGVEPLLRVMETEQISRGASSYSPITTPFGYVGSVRKKEDGSPSGMNFSFWAFSKQEPHPSFIDMPHLLTVGNPDARFSWFGHEGTGVKFRAGDPYENQNNPQQFIAYKIRHADPKAEAGSPNYYNEYSAYYYDHATNDWKILGIGHDLPNGRSVNQQVNAFLEVPGAPNRNRTGHLPREVTFRGWIYGSDGHWYPLDTMESGGAKGTETTPLNKKWKVLPSGDNFSLVQTGLFQYANQPKYYHLSDVPAVPDHIKNRDADNFLKKPISVEILTDNVKRSGSTALIDFSLSEMSDDTQVTVYYGNTDSLTYLETMSGSNAHGSYRYQAWDPKQSKVLNANALVAGTNTVQLENLKDDQVYYFRIYARNEKGQSWSYISGLINKASQTSGQPIANAGKDKKVTGPVILTLSGKGSHDPDGGALSYQWVQTQGDLISGSGLKTKSPKLTIPVVEHDTEYTFRLTVTDLDGNQAVDEITIVNRAVQANLPPVVSLPAVVEVNSGDTFTLDAQSSDPEQDTLSYVWDLESEFEVLAGINSDTVTLLAPKVMKDTEFPVSVEVYDGHSRITAQAVIKVNKTSSGSGGTCQTTDPKASQYPEWNAKKIYTNETVSYEGLVYKAKWWVKGSKPSLNNAWELISQVELPWNATTVYLQGDQVNKGDSRWKAKWWTKGDEPGKANVWERVGSSSCQ